MPGLAPSFLGFLFVIFLVIYFLSSAIKILREYERGVVFRLGRVIPVKGPGLVIIWPIIDKLVKVSLRIVAMDVPSQDVITKDNISVKVNAERQKVIDFQKEPWGIKVTAVEVKNVDLPIEMQRAIAKQAEAERERRAKIIHAEGEFQASQKLADAETIIATAPSALQLRFLQPLTEIATEKNSTIIFPVPIDLIKPFLET